MGVAKTTSQYTTCININILQFFFSNSDTCNCKFVQPIGWQEIKCDTNVSFTNRSSDNLSLLPVPNSF
jgi:hypothetical protein